MQRSISSPKTPVLGNVLYGAFLLAALVIGTFAGWVNRSAVLGGLLFHPNSFINADPKPAFGNKSVETLLILGCDEDRFYHGILLHGNNVYKKFARSDMMLVCRLDFDKHEITGISIPRDTECRVPAFDNDPVLRGNHKLNAFHEIAKPKFADEATKEAIEQIIPGLQIDKVVDLDFEAIQKLVDIVGGVKVNVPKKMDYDDKAGELHIHLKPGVQTLDGYKAMGFVRFRHDRESDFGRQQRQKDFLTSFKQAAFRNILTLPELASQGKACLNFAFDDKELEALAAFAYHVPPQNIRMGMVPVVSGEGTFLHVNKKALPATLAEFGFANPIPTTSTTSDASEKTP